MRTHLLKRDFLPNPILKIIKPSFYFIRGIIYSGERNYCPICEKTYSKFLTYNQRKNSLCPGCGSLERHRLLYLYLLNHKKPLDKKNKVLHFAPEYSLQKKFKKIFGKNYLSTDIEHPEAMLHADITNLPLKNNSFNLIICNHVLQEIENDQKAISEVFRVLKKNGTTIITIPKNKNIIKTFENQEIKTNKDRAKLYGYYGAVRIYGKDFTARLGKPGFKVETIDYIKNFDKKEIDKYGLFPEKIYICKK